LFEPEFKCVYDASWTAPKARRVAIENSYPTRVTSARRLSLRAQKIARGVEVQALPKRFTAFGQQSAASTAELPRTTRARLGRSTLALPR